jgi:hypothetical protein
MNVENLLDEFQQPETRGFLGVAQTVVAPPVAKISRTLFSFEVVEKPDNIRSIPVCSPVE